MKKFRKKPDVVDAVQYDGANTAEINEFMGGTLRKHPLHGNPVVGTKQGDHLLSVGDWVTKDITGEFSTCKPDVFALTFEPIELFDRWPHVGKP